MNGCCRALVLTLMLGGAGCGAPPAPQPTADGQGTAPSGAAGQANDETERLIASPPAGWVETGALETPVLRMAEYGPAEEPVGIVERLTLEAQAGKPLPDPIGFVTSVAGDLQARCKGFQQINISSGMENGYATSVRLMICPEFRDSPHSQVVMAKAIRGEDRFYVITRRLRGPALPPASQSTADRGEARQPMSAQAMAEWSTRMKAVSLCNVEQPNRHPCPAADPADGSDAVDEPDAAGGVTAPATIPG